MAQLSMTEEEREAFLAETRIGVIAVERRDGRPPLATPVWFRYSPGGVVEITTEAASEKARLLAAGGHATLCVQREQMPPAYVTVEGSVVLGPAPREMRLDIATRYLGPEMAEGYVDATETGDDTSITLTPQTWRTVDYSKMEMPG